MFRARIVIVLAAFYAHVDLVRAQGLPEAAHVFLYFPHLADGGAPSFKFQTALTVMNPSQTRANILIQFQNDNGTPLSLDFGSGPVTQLFFSLPPNGTKAYRSTASSTSAVTGSAVLSSDMPVIGTVQFRSLVNGTPQQEISAAGVLPSRKYTSLASAQTGVAIMNIYSSAIDISLNVFDSGGRRVVGQTMLVGPNAHTSFNLNALFPSLPLNFSGSITVEPVVTGLVFASWTLSVDSSGVLSSYPTGGQEWPISHLDRIWDVYRRDMAAAQTLSDNFGLGLVLNFSSMPLNVLFGKQINAYALSRDSSVNIDIALSELISDSPSELAFAIAHEMGHILQFKTGRKLFNLNTELDADAFGMLISLAAGYDPYAAAGTLAKLAMATNNASLIAQTFDQIGGDLHGSFNNRIQTVYSLLVAICQTPEGKPFCAAYKASVHPDFPGTAPLFRRSLPTVP